MEKYEKLSEEETYMWIPVKFLDQTLKAILKCLGLLHHDSPTSKTESSPVTSNQPLHYEEEEEDVAMEENVIVTSRGSKNLMTSRGAKVQGKKRNREQKSTGRSGQHHKYEL